MDDFFDWYRSHLNVKQQKSGGHISCWYPSKVRKRLEKLGFNVKNRGFKESRVFR